MYSINKNKFIYGILDYCDITESLNNRHSKMFFKDTYKQYPDCILDIICDFAFTIKNLD